MTIDDKIRDKKLYVINREAAKILALSSDKMNKYHYLKKYYLMSKKNDRTSKFTYSPLEKALQKQTKIIEDQKKELKFKSFETSRAKIKDVIPEDQLNK